MHDLVYHYTSEDGLKGIIWSDHLYSLESCTQLAQGDLTTSRLVAALHEWSAIGMSVS